MTTDPPILATVGEISRRLKCPLHRIEYVIRTRKINPSGRAGNSLVYPDEAVARIRDELRKMDRERSGGD